MGKSKTSIPPVADAIKDLKKNIIKNVYFLFGEDSFSIDNFLSFIDKKTEPLITTDFDREVVYAENKSAVDIVNIASTYPFGSERKFVVVKEFEKIKDRKGMINFLKSPPEFIILVLLHNNQITSFESEFYKTLSSKGFIYEAKELKGRHLVNWLIEYTESKGKILTEENAQLMTDITGENRSLLEMQLERMITFMAEKKEITYQIIMDHSAALKEYNIFDLQNAIGKKDKAAANKIAFNMIGKGEEPVYIIFMLTRYFTGLMRINELEMDNTNMFAAARIVGTHPSYYGDYQAARKRFSEQDIHRAVRSLLQADEMVKTTSTDKKTVMSLLINNILH